VTVLAISSGSPMRPTGWFAAIVEDKKGPLFRSFKKGGKLTRNAVPPGVTSCT
jgi:hypothetical protein